MEHDVLSEYTAPDIISEETFDIEEGGISLMAQCFCRSGGLGSQSPNCYAYYGDPTYMIV